MGNPQEVRWEDWERRPVGFTPQRRIKGGGVRRPGAQTGCSSVSGLRVEFCQPPPPLTLGSEAQPIGGRDGGLGEGGGVEGGEADKARRICSTFRRPPLNNTQPCRDARSGRRAEVAVHSLSLTPPSSTSITPSPSPPPPPAGGLRCPPLVQTKWTLRADGLSGASAGICRRLAAVQRDMALTCDAARQFAAVSTVSPSLSHSLSLS